MEGRFPRMGAVGLWGKEEKGGDRKRGRKKRGVSTFGSVFRIGGLSGLKIGLK